MTRNIPLVVAISAISIFLSGAAAPIRVGAQSAPEPTALDAFQRPNIQPGRGADSVSKLHGLSSARRDWTDVAPFL